MKLLLFVFIMCLFLILLVWILRKKIEIVLNFLLRIVFGFLAIFLANYCLAYYKIDISVGYNPISALTLGTLGISGFVMLYGIVLGKFL